MKLKSAYLALIFAALIWGATGPVMKLVLETVPVFVLAFIRFYFASILLLPFVIKKLAVNKKDIPQLIIASLCGVTFNIFFFFSGLKLTTALNSGILITTTPIFTLLFAHLFLKEKQSKKLFLGASLGFIGIMIITSGSIINQGINVLPSGDFLILLAVFVFVISQLLSKKLFKTYDPLVITFYFFAIGALSFLPFAFWQSNNNPQWIHNLTKDIYISILYGIFFSSFAAYSLWQWGLSKLSASKVGFFLYLDPISSTIVAVILLSEKITPTFILGAAFILMAIFIAEGHIRHFKIKPQTVHSGVFVEE